MLWQSLADWLMQVRSSLRPLGGRRGMRWSGPGRWAPLGGTLPRLCSVRVSTRDRTSVTCLPASSPRLHSCLAACRTAVPRRWSSDKSEGNQGRALVHSLDFERGGTESAVLSGAVRGEQDGFEQRASITRLVLLVASDEASFSASRPAPSSSPPAPTCCARAASSRA